MPKSYKVGQCYSTNRVFVTVDNKQVEIHMGDLGIEVQISQGDQVLAECGVDYD